MASLLILHNNWGNIFPGAGGYSEYIVEVLLTGNYPTGGEPIDFRRLPLIKASGPAVVSINGQYAGYLFEWVFGTSVADGLLKIYTPETGGILGPGIELAAGAYPRDLDMAVVIKIRALFRKNI